MERAYQVCKQCIMDTSDPEIEFDENGKCNHCYAYAARAKEELLDTETASRRLKRIVSIIKEEGKNKPYDCIIGVSGGVDSSMVAYLCKNMGLRPLAVHLDNGWDAELAVHNIETVLNNLNIDLHTHVIDWEVFRDLQMAFFRSSVANIEVLTDHAIMALLFQLASKNNIKYVISGGNIASEAIMPDSWMYDSRDLRHIKSITKRFGKGSLKTFPKCSLLKYFYYIFIKRIKYIPILNYIEFNKAEAKALIQEQFGWRDYGGKHYESIFTKFFQAYYLPQKYNIDKRRAHLSTLICSGQITRDDALAEMERPLYTENVLREDYAFFLKKMEITNEEFEGIQNLPIKTFKDFPSNSFLFTKRPWLIKFIKGIVKPSALKA